VEPTYQQFGSQKESASVAGTATVHYKSIELPVGVRHYFFFSDYSKLFLNVFYVADLSFDSYFRFKNDPYLKEIKPGGNFAFGAGYDCKKFGIEARYNMRRSVTETYLLWFSEYNKLSLIFAYRIF
jgi:hypothetical protein